MTDHIASNRQPLVSEIHHRAMNIRQHALEMAAVQGQGYVGQALGIADVLAVAYFSALNYRSDDPAWEGRDRFLLSIGHYAIALYAALIEAGVIPRAELETYGSDDSRLPMSGMAPPLDSLQIMQVMTRVESVWNANLVMSNQSVSRATISSAISRTDSMSFPQRQSSPAGRLSAKH